MEGQNELTSKSAGGKIEAKHTTTVLGKKKLRIAIKKKKGIKLKPSRFGPARRVASTTSMTATVKTSARGTSIGKNNNRRKLNGGLPSTTNSSIRTSVEHDTNETGTRVDEFDYGNDDDEHFLLPSDTLIAIQSIQQDAQGLHIPCNGPSTSFTIQAVLESQIYNKFDANHSSIIFQELRNSFTKKKIKALPCLGIGSSNTISTTSTSTTSSVASSNLVQQQQAHKTRIAFVTTTDYISGVWMAHENFLYTNNNQILSSEGIAANTTTSSSRPIHQRPLTNEIYDQIITWFTTHLSTTWTKPSIISKHDLELEWQNLIVTNGVELGDPSSTSSSNNDRRIIVTLDHALYYLQVQLQVLMKDGSRSTAIAASVSDNEIYHLWLPQWGIVLKAWNEAQQQLIAQIKRSRGGIAKQSIGHHNSRGVGGRGGRKATGEISEQNLLHTNRHANISTKFLLDDLYSQGIIKRIQRPFGTFIQLE